MVMERFNVLVVRPALHNHYQACEFFAHLAYHGLRRLGYEVSRTYNERVPGTTNIIVGAHYLEPDMVDQLPPASIIYNSEMVVRGSPLITDLMPFVERCETWDYSLANIEGWRERGVSSQLRWLRTGYLPESTTID